MLSGVLSHAPRENPAAQRHKLEDQMEKRSDHQPAAAGVHQGTISAAERGSRTSGVDIVLNLCEALGMSPNELFQKAGLLPAEGVEDEIGFWELWSIMRRLPVDDRREVIRYAMFREQEAR